MAPRTKCLLLVVDGSPYALQTVRYAGEEPAFKGMKVVIYHVLKIIPMAYYHLERELKNVNLPRHMCSWGVQHKKNIFKYMCDARQILIKAGHEDTLVQIKIQNCKKGVVRDIITEARKGYDAILLRWPEATAGYNTSIGGVASKLLEKISHIPVFIAGNNPINNRVILTMVGGHCATRVVQLVANMLRPSNTCQVRLIHLRPGNSNSNVDALTTNGADGTDLIFKKAIDTLTASGFDRDNISTKTIVGMKSGGRAIIDEAEENDWGTIVLGRAGLSNVRNVLIGSVSNKMTNTGRKHTVWVVP